MYREDETSVNHVTNVRAFTIAMIYDEVGEAKLLNSIINFRIICIEERALSSASSENRPEFLSSCQEQVLQNILWSPCKYRQTPNNVQV